MTALRLAEDLADKPDVSLRLLKQALSHRLRLELPVVIAREKAMHEAAFAQPDAIDRINQRLGRWSGILRSVLWSRRDGSWGSRRLFRDSRPT